MLPHPLFPPPPRFLTACATHASQVKPSKLSEKWRPTEAVLFLHPRRRRCRAPSRRRRCTTSRCARRTVVYGSGTPTRARCTGNTCLPRTLAPLVRASPGDHAERPRYIGWAVSQTDPHFFTHLHFVCYDAIAIRMHYLAP